MNYLGEGCAKVVVCLFVGLIVGLPFGPVLGPIIGIAAMLIVYELTPDQSDRL